MNKIIAYQGEPGANSHIACADVYPGWDTLPCASFRGCFRPPLPRAAPNSA